MNTTDLVLTGKIFGTNTGNALLSVDDTRNGLFRILDDVHGLHIFEVSVEASEGTLSFGGPNVDAQDRSIGPISVSGRLQSDGSYQCRWHTTGGYAGVLRLFPTPQQTAIEPERRQKTDQLYTKREVIGLIDINKKGLLDLSSVLQQQIEGSEVIVTIDGETKQEMLLSDFIQREPSFYRVRRAALFISQLEQNNLTRSIRIEFDELENDIVAQSSDESWAIGVVEKTRRYTKSYELPSFLSFEKLGAGINILILLGMLVSLPSFASVPQRIAYVAAIFAVMVLNAYLYKSYVPNSRILLSDDRRTRVQVIFGRWVSWLFGLLATSFATFVTVKFDSIWRVLTQFFSAG